MTPEPTNTPQFGDLPDPFPAVVQAAAREMLGVPVCVWVEEDGWRVLVGPENTLARDFGPGLGVDERLLQHAWQHRPAVCRRALDGGGWLVGIPLEFEQTRPLVAVAGLEMSPEEMADCLGCRFAEQVVRTCCGQNEQTLMASYAYQLTKDLEELTYLHGLAERFEFCELARSADEVAQRLLPELRGVIGAEAVAWVDMTHGAADCTTGADSSTRQGEIHWTGPRLLNHEACVELIARLVLDGTPGPVVNNCLDRWPEKQRLPGVRGALLVPVEKGGGLFGWLLGLNRAPPADRACPCSGRSVPLSEYEFGTGEVGLARMAASVLATHLHNIELFEAACQARDRAEAANQAKSRFLAGVSHEIRTPLTAILGYAEILAEECAGPATEEPLQVIRRNTESLLQVVSDVLDLSKIEAEVVEVQREPCSPLSLAAEVAAAVRIRAEAKGLVLHVEPSDSVPDVIYTDPARLRQILLNLADNAVKFTASGKVSLVVGSRVDQGGETRVTFAVVDTGVGMTAEQAAAVFEPFVQCHEEPPRRGGSAGLGLAISERLAGLLGGRIVVHTAPQAGCTFELVLPVGEPAGPAAAAPSVSSSPRTADHSTEQRPSRLEGLRILLAEDCRDNQRLVSHLLRKAGIEVVLAQNGQAAVESARRAQGEGRPFDLILMDIQMPELDGLEATAQLRDEGYSGAIVALTAYALSDDRRRCLEAGCNDYLTKPIRRDHLLQVVARFAPQAAQTPGD